MPKVMEVQIVYRQHLAGTGECGTNRIGGVGQDSFVKSWH